MSFVQFPLAITVLPKTAKLSINEKEINLGEDGSTPDMYDIDETLKVKATAEGHADLEKEYKVKDELTGGKNTLDLTLIKNKV